MNISIVKVKNEKSEMKWLKGLFIAAFPPDERPPFFIMRWKAKNHVDWWKVVYEKENAGFFYVIRNKNIAYVIFLAIDEKLRGKHIGTEALKLLIKMYDDKELFLAIEQIDASAPNLQERINRKNFYMRCGLIETNNKVKEGSLEYELLGTKNTIINSEYDLLMKSWSGFIMSKLWPMHCF